ncbi:carboxylesterase/lipase family protein [Fundidesulfovibrio magnetotacticus]|nr:carboxylesterase/lipase family protein [Fundidesulfovibrio magnetotacticus]
MSALALLLALLACATARAADASLQAPVVLDSGPVTGLALPGLHAYLGIPYAAPPVGALRWRPPQPPAAWSEPRPCTAFGPGCPQPAQKPEGRFSEDCLTLNVWTPAASPGGKLPVMVWVHGGGFNFGASSQPEYDGAELARRGVVTVTLNYRLGPLGFLVHPALDGESSHGVSGNYGLLDQMAGLAWVRRNIAVFGGDPDNVTLFGQSAGSRSVSLQLLSPLSEGLFRRAIAQSGGPVIGSEYLSPVFDGDRPRAARMGLELARRLGADGAPDPLAVLRAATADEVVRAAACDTGLFAEEIFFSPVFDGWALPADPGAAIASGRMHPVPVMTGSTANEGAAYLGREKNLDRARYETFLKSRFGARWREAAAAFPARADADVPGAIDRVVTVGANVEPARFMARSQASRGRKAWLFHFSRVPGTDLARRFGAHHGVDLAYVFGNLEPPQAYDATDRELSRQVMDYWTNFARTGNPNGPGLPPWPACRPGSEPVMDFGDAPRLRRELFPRQADFVAGVSRFPREARP